MVRLFCTYNLLQNPTKFHFNGPGKTRICSVKGILALFRYILTSGLFQSMGVSTTRPILSVWISIYSFRARSIQPKFPEISVQNSMDRFGPTGKVSKKQVHLLRWSSFPGRTGLNFGWMDRALSDTYMYFVWVACGIVRHIYNPIKQQENEVSVNFQAKKFMDFSRASQEPFLRF